MDDASLLMVISELVSSSSSSSSSSDTDSFFSTDSDGDFVELDRFFKERNERHSVKNFVQDVVLNYTDDEFRRHFRVSRQTAAVLTQKFQCSKYYKRRTKPGGKPQTSAEVQCLSFLWFAGNKNTYREVSNLFDMTLSSAYRNQTAFLEFLFEISPDYIKMPRTDSEKRRTSSEFEKLAGFKNVLGCIDGCYIYIRNPAHKIRSTYVNRHGLISITLQGICDADKKFLDVYVGPPSKIHDSRIFTMSPIYEKIAGICDKQYHLLGDAAYPLREYLLTPYRDYGDLTTQQKAYNKIHCQTRVKIENCFGLLKQRFRQLMRLDCWTVQRMAKFTLACCVLHNLCIMEGDVWEENTSSQHIEAQEGTSSESEDSVVDSMLTHYGQLKRNAIAETL